MLQQQEHNEPDVDLNLALEHGLTEEEYKRILEILGRVPSYTELGIYSVMWSEHCSYKNSIAVLKTLPRSGARLLVEAGEENAGVVDIGDGLGIAFKIESHNHPSAVEPYQGAATGVGGILRDIFTMGARPIAALNSLRFGELSNDRVKYLFKGVVKGIGDYGNSFGVPTVAGEVYFDPSYTDNPLVNAMAVGVVERGKMARAIAKGTGNLVMIVGSSTGRDGIHGATFASEEISEKSEAKRPSVQVGDPFTEKLLLEATLEAISAGLIVGIQDMGAAGLTCSSMEMSAKGSSGMRLDLDAVPLREKSMSSYEILLSESQERMLLVAEPKDEIALKKIFDKWDLHAVTIGEVTMGGRVQVYHRGELKADVPAETLVLGGGAPVYSREAREPQYLKEVRSFDPTSLPLPKDYNKVLMDLLRSPTVACKRWVYHQYDSMVRTGTVPVSYDAAVVRIKGTKKAIVLKTDCNGRFVYLNPRRGGQIAVAEAARNVACTGATPVAITNCLNFGNPYNPEVYWQFKEAVTGIGDACRVLDTPVTGGNVSFYNESPDAAVLPTPVIGMLGLLSDAEKAVPSAFQSSGDLILLLGKELGEIGGSEYLFQQSRQLLGDAPAIDLNAEKSLQALCIELSAKSLINSAHDCAEGGLAVALAEAVIESASDLGATITNFPDPTMRPDFSLFGETQSRIIASCNPSNFDRLRTAADRHGVQLTQIGRVDYNPRLSIRDRIDLGVAELRGVYRSAISIAVGETG
ncbi:MAG: phosphoribosylformylglycinamidine synthase II [Ignavibacteria bacterium GWA2_54_16]|nr:MAG: phosphoribosylformylglycinamidine synthase II [Ignavibacteria bacterium GWA2_54_16]